MRNRWPNHVAWCLAAATLSVSIGTGTLAQAKAGPATAYPNVQVSHVDGAAVEPSIAVDSRNPRDMIAASMIIHKHRVTVAASRSLDGGRSWTAAGTLAAPRQATWTGDVTVAFDHAGVGYVTAAYQTARHGDGIVLWRTTDVGRRFHGPTTVARVPFADRPGLAIAPSSTSGGGRAQTLYVEWRDRHGLTFSRSTNGGTTFSSPRRIVAGDGIYIPSIASGDNGLLVIAFESIAYERNGPVSRLEAVTSTNAGVTFNRPVDLGPMIDGLTPTPSTAIPTTVSVTIRSGSRTIYVAYEARKAGKPTIELTTSQNAGQRWSPPHAIALGTRGLPFQPRVATYGARGIAISAEILAHGRVTIELTNSINDATWFQRPHQVSTEPFNPQLGVVSAPKGGGPSTWWIGDYQALAVGPDSIYPCWGDTRTGHLELFAATVATTPHSRHK